MKQRRTEAEERAAIVRRMADAKYGVVQQPPKDNPPEPRR